MVETFRTLQKRDHHHLCRSNRSRVPRILRARKLLNVIWCILIGTRKRSLPSALFEKQGSLRQREFAHQNADFTAISSRALLSCRVFEVVSLKLSFSNQPVHYIRSIFRSTNVPFCCLNRQIVLTDKTRARTAGPLISINLLRGAQVTCGNLVSYHWQHTRWVGHQNDRRVWDSLRVCIVLAIQRERDTKLSDKLYDTVCMLQPRAWQYPNADDKTLCCGR